MSRSGKLLATNDCFIEELIKDPNYDVRTDGTIWTRVARTGKVFKDESKWRELFKITKSNGYCEIRYKYKCLRRCRIVYAAHVGKLEQDLVINHKDGSKLNDSPENLELITQSENNKHRFRDLGFKPVIGNSKITYEIAQAIREDKKTGMTHKALMAKYNLSSKGTISAIVNMKIWKSESNENNNV